MYLKLALRNAKRSVFDYLLYIFSMIVLISVIFISNCIANWGKIQAGFQTMSLPLLIVVVMVFLVNYINTFIVKQRAKEFATYMLLGMEKDKLSLTFLCELFAIGMVCLFLGVILGTGIYSVYFYLLLRGTGSQSIIGIIMKSILQTFLYFCLLEVLSIIFMRQKIYKLQIIQLMREKQHNQPLEAGRKSFWGWMLFINFVSFLVLLLGISFMPERVMTAAVSIIAIPMLLCVFSFYKWMYAFLSSMRLSQADTLYQGNRLYRIAEMTSGSKTSANINTIFSICLIFSASSFVFGILLLGPDIHFFEQAQQQWMGFLQIGICVIFMVIYFSILALLQMVDLKRETRNIRLLFHMGKNQSELKSLFRTQLLVKLFLPVLMSFILLWTAVPLVNYKVNSVLPISMHNLLLSVFGGFMFCFFVLYLCYFGVVCIINTRYIKFNTKTLK